MATRIASASTVSRAPPAAGSTDATRTAPFFSTPTTLLASLNFMPCRSSRRWNCFATSPSTPGTMRSRNSTTSTSEPRRRHTEPSSSPITPAPITSSRFGTSGNDSAPVDDTIWRSSISMPGSVAASEPVAITMFFASSSRTPSFVFTLTRPGAVIFPSPTMPVTLFFLNRNSTPLVSSPTTLFLCAIIAGRSMPGVPVIPKRGKSRRATV